MPTEALAMLVLVKRIFQQNPNLAEQLMDTDETDMLSSHLPSVSVGGLTCGNIDQIESKLSVSHAFQLLAMHSFSPYVRFLAHALYSHFGTNYRTTSLELNSHGLMRKAKELQLDMTTCQQLLRFTDALQAKQEFTISKSLIYTFQVATNTKRK